MTQGLAGLLGTLLAAGWAALLALAEGALNADPRLATQALPPSFAEQPERLRRALALGRVILLALAAVAVSGAVRWWTRPPLVAAAWFLGLAGLTALATDLLPRVVGLGRAGSVGRWAVRAAAASLAVPAPVFALAGVIDEAFARMVGVATPRRPSGADVAQRDMLLGVFALADTMVSEVMTPRVDLVGLPTTAAFDDVVRQVAAAEYARIPVFDGDLDHIVGVLHAKDLLPARFGASAGRDWRALVRPVEIVPEVKTLDQQLRDFQRGTGHLAVVVDEFGGTAGIVTLEDVLEEIVGEIRDEYDASEAVPIQQTAPGVFVVHGRAPLDLLAAALGVDLGHEEVSTAGGFAYAALGHVPVAGESLTVAGWRITVERVEKRSITRLRAERTPSPTEAPA
jgi:CBS domain containing-hemolysin-like protein